MDEVHLWRGTLAQKALRFQRRKRGQFNYFDRQLGFPDWKTKAVLDFGGNIGDLFKDSNGKIAEKDYYCTDVLDEAIKAGKNRFPDAHWFHYNRYNPSFNPNGIKGISLPEMGTNFHHILAYSVFSHTTLEDMHDLTQQLVQRLHPGGTLAFTFIDPHFRSQPIESPMTNLEWRLEENCADNSSISVQNILQTANAARWCSLVGDERLYVNSNGKWPTEITDCTSYHVYYTAGFMQQEFPNSKIQLPVNNDMQHCCLISND